MRTVVTCCSLIVSVFYSLTAFAQQKEKAGNSGIFQTVAYKGKKYFVCTVSPVKYKIEVYNKRANGKDVYDFSLLYGAMKDKLVFAVNGGMYDENRHAIGLLVAAGKTQHKINTVTTGTGNFTMQPNGVFYISRQHDAHVVTTRQYITQKPAPQYATQSGPMLVTAGEFNSNFTPGSLNLNIRNGVGVNNKGEVVFAISQDFVNFYEFAAMYRDILKCNNALYLDGAVSRFFAPGINNNAAAAESGAQLGPVIVVSVGGN